MTDESKQIAATGAGRQYRLIALDLDNEQQARAVAKKIADQSGRTVTLSDADGEVLGVFKGDARN